MKKLLISLLLCAFTTAPALASLAVNYNFVDSATHDLSSPYSFLNDFTCDTFDAATPAGWVYGGNFAIRNGDVAGLASAPFDGELPGTGKDTTDYLAVPGTGTSVNDGTPSIATVSFGGGKFTYLGLHWGSMDSYNEIRFFNNGALQDSITGAPTASGGVNRNGEGQQLQSLSNSYVNIFTDFEFDAIELRSYDTTLGASPFAFELDNLCVATPAPGAVLLGFLGLSAAGVKLRKYA